METSKQNKTQNLIFSAFATSDATFTARLVFVSVIAAAAAALAVEVIIKMKGRPAAGYKKKQNKSSPRAFIK